MNALHRMPTAENVRSCRDSNSAKPKDTARHPLDRPCAAREAGGSPAAETPGAARPRRGPARSPAQTRWPDPRRADNGARDPRPRQSGAGGRFWRPPRGRRGFSLLELLIATALGAVLTVAATQLFASAGRANAAHVGHARMQESARHVLGFLGRSIRGAGYFGCGGGTPSNGLRGHWGRIAEFDISTSVRGFDGLPDGTGWQPDVTALPLRRGAGAPTFRRGGIDPARLRPGSDILVVRRLATPIHPLLRPAAAESDPLVVLDDRSALRKDRFAALTRCGAAGLFRMTSVTRHGTAATLAHAAGSGTFGNRTGGGWFGGAGFGDGHGPGSAAVGLVLSEIYFVALGVGATDRADATWSLWRKTSAERPAELVRGIDDLQLLFAVDESPNDALVAPQRWASAGGATGAVRSVHVAVTAGVVDVSGGGATMRRTFAATFTVRNP